MTAPVETSRRQRSPRFRFVWGGAKEQPGRWYLGLVGLFERPEGRRRGIAVSGFGLLGWSAGLVVAAYFAGATLLYTLWSRNSYNLLSYSDALLYPLRRQVIFEKKGQQFIAQGSDLWREQKVHAAAALLRLGLERYPRDLKARMMLAEYYVRMNRRPLAVTVLQDGLGNDYPGRAYVQTLFNIAEQGEDYGMVLALGERFRAALPGEKWARERRWLQTKQFAALLGAGRGEEALALANQDAEWSDLAGEERVMALLALHRNEEAVKMLEQWRTRPGADLKLVIRLQVRAFREAKRLDDMERAIEELRQLTPTLPAPVVYGVVQRAMAGQVDAARRALDQYLARFGRSPADLQLVGDPLLEIGQLELVERVAQAAAERGYPPGPFQILLVQGNLLRGRWTNAAKILQEMKVPQGTTRDAIAGQVWQTWMKLIVDAALVPTDTAQVALVEFLRSRPWPMKVYRVTIDALHLAARLETERDAVNLALIAFPASAWLLQRKEEVAQAIAARPAPVAATSPVAEKPHWTETAFFDRLDELLRAAKWDDADDLIADLRRLQPPPPWVARRDDRLRLAQVRIGHGHGSTTEMLAAARVYLNGDAERSRQVLDLAREFHGNDKPAGLALAQEVQRKTPNYPPVVRLLAEWVPAQKKGTK